MYGHTQALEARQRLSPNHPDFFLLFTAEEHCEELAKDQHEECCETRVIGLRYYLRSVWVVPVLY